MVTVASADADLQREQQRHRSQLSVLQLCNGTDSDQCRILEEVHQRRLITVEDVPNIRKHTQGMGRQSMSISACKLLGKKFVIMGEGSKSMSRLAQTYCVLRCGIVWSLTTRGDLMGNVNVGVDVIRNDVVGPPRPLEGIAMSDNHSNLHGRPFEDRYGS